MKNLFTAIVLLIFVAILIATGKFGDDIQESQIQATQIASGLSMTSQFKAYVGTYYYDTGEFPANNSEAKLPDAESFASDSVKSVAIQNGTIIVTYNKKSGIDGGTIHLIPQPSNHQIEWRCETTSYKLINSVIPQCHYVKM